MRKLKCRLGRHLPGPLYVETTWLGTCAAVACFYCRKTLEQYQWDEIVDVVRAGKRRGVYDLKVLRFHGEDY